MREAFGRALIELAEEFDDLVVLDSDNSTSTKTTSFADRFPDSFFNVGIAEQNLVSVAAGLALAGCRPVASAFASMLVNRGLDQITHSVAYQNLGVVLVGHYAGLSGGREGACHHSINDLGALRGVPNLTLLVAASDYDVYPLLKLAVESRVPVYLRLSREPAAGLPASDRGSLPAGWRYWGPQDADILIVSCGPILSAALAAKATIPGSVGVLEVLRLSPFPDNIFADLRGHTHAIVTVEEHSVVGGLGGAVSEWASERRPILCRRLGIYDEFTVSGAYTQLLELYGLTRERIAETVRSLRQEMRRG
jgi:transketolase